MGTFWAKQLGDVLCVSLRIEVAESLMAIVHSISFVSDNALRITDKSFL